MWWRKCTAGWQYPAAENKLRPEERKDASEAPCFGRVFLSGALVEQFVQIGCQPDAALLQALFRRSQMLVLIGIA